MCEIAHSCTNAPVHTPRLAPPPRRPADQIFAFSQQAVNSVVKAYVPLVVKHKDDPFTAEEKQWQQLRRGR
jgi:coproporphyrinogen III oxidase